MSTDMMTFAPLLDMARQLAPAELLPKHLRGKPADLFLTLQLGRELGIAPMQSIRAIHVIEGKPTMSADLMGALCMARRDVCEYLRPVELTSAVATYEAKRIGWPQPMRLSFTIEDAQAAGLTGKDVWRKYPAAMLKSRALSAIVRAAFPDLMLGICDPDELDAAQPAGASVEPIDVTPVEPPPAPKTSKLKSKLPPLPVDIGDLRAEFTKALPESIAPSDFREWLLEQPEFVGKEIPPVSQWDAARLQWAIKALGNGLGARFRAYLAEPAPEFIERDPRDPDEMPE